MRKNSPEYDGKTIHEITVDCQDFVLLLQIIVDHDAAKMQFYKQCTNKYGNLGTHLAFAILQAVKISPNYTLNQIGDILMPNAKKAGRDNVDASMNAGRDIISSAGGMKNKATIRDNKTKTENIDQSHSVNPKLLKALESGRKAIDKLKMTEAMKELLKKEYEELAAEVSKPKPEKSAVKKLWESVSHFAGKAAPLIGLGKLIAGMFGLKLAGVETTPEA